MKILVAGATGTLGLPVVEALVARGYQVVGLVRSPEKRTVLEQRGAETVVADALDADALEQAFRNVSPDCVVDLLTAIPKNGPIRYAHMRATNELRVTGTANLLTAAVAAGARRFIAESMIFAYGFGDHGRAAKSEGDTLQPREAAAGLQDVVDALRSLEEQCLAATERGLIEAIPLRYGLFYGSGAPSTRYMVQMIRRRRLPLISGADGLISWIHLDDAVTATIAALEGGSPGEIYNIVDDCPVSLNSWIGHIASATGSPPPRTMPLWLLRWLMPYVAAVFSTQLPVSNRKAKQALGWQPQFPSYEAGVQEVIAGVRPS